MTQRHYIAIEASDTLTLKNDRIDAPSDEEVVIDVDFAGINRADVLQRLGLYPAPVDASPIMGLEVAGTIVELGANVRQYNIGDRVCALTHGGGYASHAVARVDHCLTIPDDMDSEQAAALPEALLTCWHNIFERGALQPHETLLVQGGASGIGTIAVQMAKAMGSRVVSTAGSEKKCHQVAQLGAELVVNYREGDFAATLADAGYQGEINVILDMAGGDFAQAHINLAAVDGRIVCIGVMRGMDCTINLASLFMKRLQLTGSTLRAMAHSEKADSFTRIREVVMPLVADKKIKPVIHATYPLAQALSAHEAMLAGQHTGKILLDCRR